MSSELMLNNLLLWSIQMVALLAIATLFPALARLTTPSARLAYWQFALLTCLALPVENSHPFRKSTLKHIS